MYTVLTNVLSIHSFILCVSVAVTNSIVKLHEGSISVFSEGEGHGCTFTVELPVLTREDIIEEGISSVSPPVQPTDTIVLSSMLEAPDPDPRYKGPSIVDAAADNNDQDEKSNDDCLPIANETPRLPSDKILADTRGPPPCRFPSPQRGPPACIC